MRRRAPAERDLLQHTGFRIEAAGKALLLAADPHRAVGRGRDIVRIGAGRKLIVAHLRGPRGAKRERDCRERSEDADHEFALRAEAHPNSSHPQQTYSDATQA